MPGLLLEAAVGGGRVCPGPAAANRCDACRRPLANASCDLGQDLRFCGCRGRCQRWRWSLEATRW